METNQGKSFGATGPQPGRHRTKLVVTIIAVLVLTVVSAIGAYVWRDTIALAQLKKKDDKIADLEKQNGTLKATIAQQKAAEDANKKDAAAGPSTATLKLIEAAVKEKHLTELEPYMAQTVRVIVAASEGIGDRTPDEAVSDVSYINSAITPWNFALSPAELATLRAGDYASYFPSGALVGKSSNNYVVSFTFNEAGAISGIFMASDAAML